MREKIMNHPLNKLFLYFYVIRKRNLKQNFIIGALGLLFIVIKEDSATLSIWIRSQFFHGIIEPYLLPSSTFKIILFSGTIKVILHPFFYLKGGVPFFTKFQDSNIHQKDSLYQDIFFQKRGENCHFFLLFVQKYEGLN